ncbi:SUMF1/EgtB/PvdO family nonheme iron enzyme [candidate division WOR-3 bacterium]|nr:SUMF1/EgtB/PvdO family nonheme iron enzyme [candidate division WOR-3 bacterium]
MLQKGFVYLSVLAILAGCERKEKISEDMVLVPAGTFIMGSTTGKFDEQPEHEVYVDSFYIDKYEVTNREYKEFCDRFNRPYPPEPGFDGMEEYFLNYPDYPVVNVSWESARDYCFLHKLKRLPTEAEWEKAARGTDKRKYPWGNQWDSLRCSNQSKSPVPVGSFKLDKSPYGCYDMAGNVQEWVSDNYEPEYYKKSPGKNPECELTTYLRCIRGGSYESLTPETDCQCTARDAGFAKSTDSYIGFRCAKEVR